MKQVYSFDNQPYFKNYKFNSEDLIILNNNRSSDFIVLLNYIISQIFNKMLNEFDNNKRGKDAFIHSRSGWLTIDEFINITGIKIERGVISVIFDIFAYHQLLLKRNISGEDQYKYNKDPRIYNNNELDDIISSNYILTQYINHTLNFFNIVMGGDKKISKNDNIASIMLESVHATDFYKIFIDQSLKIIFEKSNFTDVSEIKIAVIAMDGGYTAINIINEILDRYTNLRIKLFCYEERSNQLIRTHHNVNFHIIKNQDKILDKGLDIKLSFTQIEFGQNLGILVKSLDLCIATFVLQYMDASIIEDFVIDVKQSLKKSGYFVTTQFTNLSTDRVNPMTLFYLLNSNVYSLPSKNYLKKIGKNNFKTQVSSVLDTVWLFHKPK